MDALTSAFYDVMYFYEIPFTPQGVEANLNKWRTAKAPLLELLRRHPNWNEDELAIVFDFSEGRGIDRNCVDECKFELVLLAQEVGLSEQKLADFTAALDAATADYAAVPDPSRLSVIREQGHIKCSEGQKASRIINRLCGKFGLDVYEVDKLFGEHGENPTIRRVKPYNAVFARLADSLNPVVISKTGILSLHPCDFLEMSSKRNAWHSCHCLDDGGYKAGCQSYMGDGVSMVFYTVDEDIKQNFRSVPRITRQMFFFQDGMLLQSRLYPNNDAEIRKLYRDIVQRAISQCLGMPNLWKAIKDFSTVRTRLKTAEDSLHYPDYENQSYAVMTCLQGIENAGSMEIGSRSLCSCCGEPHANHHNIKCYNCDSTTVCKDCGHVIPMSNAIYNQGLPYCEDCASRCTDCGTVLLRSAGAGQEVTLRNGRIVRLCAACYDRATEGCGQCSVRELCGAIGGNRFCPRSQVSIAA